MRCINWIEARIANRQVAGSCQSITTSFGTNASFFRVSLADERILRQRFRSPISQRIRRQRIRLVSARRPIVPYSEEERDRLL